MKKIGFIGIGKLGLDCAEVMAEKHEVRGYDIYPRESDSVKVCDIAELVDESEWIFIAVPTPHAQGYDGSVPSSHMEPRDFGHDAVIDAIKNVNKYATTPKKVVLISTVLPGTTRKHFYPLLDSKHQFLYNPYLIAMGSVKWDMVNPEMVMIGTEDGNPNALASELIDLYKTIMVNDPRYEIGTWDECEAIKIFYNTFISAKVGLVNMIQDFALRIGNIALRWLAKEYNIGYDLFDTVMHAREVQAKNLANYLLDLSVMHDNLPIVIHGKAYKPDVEYCIGSYSTLVGHYIEQEGRQVVYVDPLADDPTNVVATVDTPAIFLWAHNRKITYEYTGDQLDTQPYCNIMPGSIIVDPWRKLKSTPEVEVVHYGNTRVR